MCCLQLSVLLRVSPVTPCCTEVLLARTALVYNKGGWESGGTQHGSEGLRANDQYSDQSKNCGKLTLI